MICNATARCNRPMWPPDVIARCNRPQQEAIANMDISYVDLWLALGGRWGRKRGGARPPPFAVRNGA